MSVVSEIPYSMLFCYSSQNELGNLETWEEKKYGLACPISCLLSLPHAAGHGCLLSRLLLWDNS